MDAEVPLSEADVGELESQLVQVALRSGALSSGRMVARFEAAFANQVGRAHAVAVPSGLLGTWLALRALGIGPGDEVIGSTHGWHQVAQAVSLTGATLVFTDIDYWSGCLDAARADAAVTPATKAAVVGNVNGHPAAWKAWRALAQRRGLALVEDSTEAIGSRYAGAPVGSFGDVSVFDFSQPSALVCGEGGMVVTDDDRLASELRYLRSRTVEDRQSVSVGSRVPMQALMGEATAAIGLAQVSRLDEILARRKEVEGFYLDRLASFEGIKPPYRAPDVDEVHWMLWLVHLGKRFTASAVAQVVEDLRTAGVASALYCQPLHQQFFHAQRGWKRGALPLAERIADRALALPFHGRLDADHVAFVVDTLKDSSVNVGAGAAIY